MSVIFPLLPPADCTFKDALIADIVRIHRTLHTSQAHMYMEGKKLYTDDSIIVSTVSSVDDKYVETTLDRAREIEAYPGTGYDGVTDNISRTQTVSAMAHRSQIAPSSRAYGFRVEVNCNARPFYAIQAVLSKTRRNPQGQTFVMSLDSGVREIWFYAANFGWLKEKNVYRWPREYDEQVRRHACMGNAPGIVEHRLAYKDGQAVRVRLLRDRQTVSIPRCWDLSTKTYREVDVEIQFGQATSVTQGIVGDCCDGFFGLAPTRCPGIFYGYGRPETLVQTVWEKTADARQEILEGWKENLADELDVLNSKGSDKTGKSREQKPAQEQGRTKWWKKMLHIGSRKKGKDSGDREKQVDALMQQNDDMVENTSTRHFYLRALPRSLEVMTSRDEHIQSFFCIGVWPLKRAPSWTPKIFVNTLNETRDHIFPWQVVVLLIEITQRVAGSDIPVVVYSSRDRGHPAPFKVMLDTGAAHSWLPRDITDGMKGVYDTELKQYKRPKDHVKDLFSKMDLRIVFRGVNSEAATLWIPAVDFMLYVYNSTSSDSISLHCPIVETSWEAGVFGANFFRSVFFAGYDPEDPNQDPYVKLAPQYQNESQDYTFVS